MFGLRQRDWVMQVDNSSVVHINRYKRGGGGDVESWDVAMWKRFL